MESWFRTLLRQLKLQNRYFTEAKEEIKRTNLHLLKVISVVQVVFLAFFLTVTPQMFPGWHATFPYWMFLIMAVFVAVIIYIIAGSGKAEADTVSLLCVLFYVGVLCGCMAVDILPDAEVRSTYFHIILVVLPALLVMPITVLFPLTLTMEILYFILVGVYKTPQVAAVDAYNSLIGFLCSLVVMINVTELRTREGLTKYRYIRQGTTDPLTGVENRAESEMQIRGYFAARHEKDEECALLMFDIDNFKQINDRYGHQAGDQILTAIGKVLREGFREDDVIGRIGGDEFMVLLKSVRGEDSLGELAERVLDQIKRLSDQCGMEISCSLGIARTETITSYEEMYRLADEGMYEAKRSGAGKYVIKRAKAGE